jgi:hypothetical protein
MTLNEAIEEIENRAEDEFGVGVKNTDIPKLIRALREAISQRDRALEGLFHNYNSYIDYQNTQILAAMESDEVKL